MTAMRMASIVLVFVLGVSTRVHAEDVPPWVAGVSDAQKKSAKRLLDSGNVLFLGHDYVAALEQYKQAVAAWDHPAIRFNIVRCLIQLDRTLEAVDNLELALKYGAAPLEEAVYNEALGYQKLLANQIGDITVRCEQAGVKVSLDGQPLPDCPGVEQRRVTPGRHQIVGVKQGFLTNTREVFVVGGKHEEVAVSLAPVGQSAQIVRRWSTWIPWVVFGAGLTMTGVGGLIELQASQDLAAYDRELASGCPNVGCDANHPVPASIAHLKTRGERENAIAGVAVAAGASAAITGAVLLYLNRGRTVYPKESSGPSLGRIDVVPQAGGATITLAGQF